MAAELVIERLARWERLDCTQPGAAWLGEDCTLEPCVWQLIIEFTRDFQVMWPAAIGSGYVS